MSVQSADLTQSRKIGPMLATFLVAGNMIGSGVYLLPATLGVVGSVSIVGWVVAGVGAMLLAAVFALLTQARPNAHGLVAYAAEGLGRFFGFEAAFAYWLSCVAGNLAIAVAAVGYLGFFLPVLKDNPLVASAATAAVIWVLIAANIVGPKFVGRVQGATLAVGLVPILAAAILGWFFFDPEIFRASWNVTDPPKSDVAAVTASLVMVFWAFTGLESAAACARVVRDPARNVPIATFAGVALAAVIYVAASAAVFGVLPAAMLAASSAPFADVVAKAIGVGFAAVVAGCAVFKASGTLSGWVLVTAQTSQASAEAGYFPKVLSGARADGVPVRDLVVLGLLMTLIAFATAAPTIGERFGVLINVATNLSLAVYGLCCIALFRFAGALERHRMTARVVAVLGLAFSVWTIAVGDPEMLKVQGVLLVVSLPAWALVWWAGRAKAAPASAQ